LLGVNVDVAVLVTVDVLDGVLVAVAELEGVLLGVLEEEGVLLGVGVGELMVGDAVAVPVVDAVRVGVPVAVLVIVRVPEGVPWASASPWTCPLPCTRGREGWRVQAQWGARWEEEWGGGE
jgi:hypothetical protein